MIELKLSQGAKPSHGGILPAAKITPAIAEARGLGPAPAEHRVAVPVVAAIPGAYTGRASRAYLYYGDEHKAWTAGLSVEIEPLSEGS